MRLYIEPTCRSARYNTQVPKESYFDERGKGDEKEFHNGWLEDPEAFIRLEGPNMLKSVLRWIKNPNYESHNIRLIGVLRTQQEVLFSDGEPSPTTEVTHTIVEVPDEEVDAYIEKIQNEKRFKVTKLLN